MGQKQRRARGQHTARYPSGWRWLAWAIPPLLAVFLVLPCLRFTFIWDDFEFLREALSFHPSQLLPAAGHDFYRPISRQAYFGLVALLGEHKAVLSHLINAGIVVASILVFQKLATGVAGSRAGIFAGALFASLGQLPVLVAWSSGVQDLLAILFIATALLLRWKRREAPALVVTACALLSKETAAAFVPAIVLLNWILGRKPYDLASALRYGLVLGSWAAIHPGLRELMTSGFHRGATVYIGTDSAQPPALKIVKYVLLLFQLPIPGVPVDWPDGGFWLLGGGTLAAVLLVRLAPREPARPKDDSRPSAARVAALAVLLSVSPLALSAVLVRHWLPYYVVIAGLGASLLLAIPLARAPDRIAGVALAAFVGLGILSRGLAFPPDVASERNFRTASETLQVIESGFRSLYPSLPRGTQAVVSVQVGGGAGAYRQLFGEQALSVWYGDVGIRTLRAVEPRDRAKPEVLFVVTPGLDVVEMDPDTYRARSSGRMPEYVSAETALRLYAMGTFASGDPDRAVRILTAMPEYDASLASAHGRLASAFLESAGRRREADSLRAGLPPLPRNYALQTACGYLADPLQVPIDEGVLRAFSVAPEDTASMLKIVRCLEKRGSYEQALAMARRLRSVRPSDEAANAAVERIERTIEARASLSP